VLKCHLIQVNLPYILWVAAFNTWFLFAYFILDILFYPSPERSKTQTSSSTRDKGMKEPVSNYQGKDQHPKASPAPLLEAINKNGLALFLLVSADSFSFLPHARIKLGEHMYRPGQFVHAHN
jgi:hypothetical protein